MHVLTKIYKKIIKEMEDDDERMREFDRKIAELQR